MRCLPFRVRVTALATAGLVVGACTSAPPVQEMSDARQAIASAAEANAGTYAPGLLADAERLIESAESQLRQEAYGRARYSALRAKNRALRALEQATAAAEAGDAPR